MNNLMYFVVAISNDLFVINWETKDEITSTLPWNDIDT